MSKKDDDQAHDQSRGLFYSNYDYIDDGSGEGPGTSVYRQMDQVKSVDEWRRKMRDRRKKRLKKMFPGISE